MVSSDSTMALSVQFIWFVDDVCNAVKPKHILAMPLEYINRTA